jgi:hypothetical protein
MRSRIMYKYIGSLLKTTSQRPHLKMDKWKINIMMMMMMTTAHDINLTNEMSHTIFTFQYTSGPE